MKLVLALILAATTLVGCGQPKSGAETKDQGGSGVALPVIRPATIKGNALVTQWLCGGAATPEHQGPCSKLVPYGEAEFAVAKIIDLEHDVYELVEYVKADKNGNFSVQVKPGTYTLVNKSKITHAEEDDNFAYLMQVKPFTVKPGQSIDLTIEFMTPPPPISIGVGN